MQYSLVLAPLNTESQPLFSVVIPCHNAAKFFSQTLDSLVAQKEKDFEVVIVDDCSADSNELQKIATDYKDKLALTLIRTHENINGAGARNLGVELSQGKYIAFLDADDLFEQDKLNIYSQLLGQHDDDVILYSQLKFKSRDETNYQLRPSAGKPKSMRVGEYLFGHNGLMQTSTLAMPKSVFQKVEFNPSFRRHQDYDFVLRAAALGMKFVYIPQPLVIWHKPETRKTTTIKKGASTQYCFYWLNEMRDYLSEREQALYRIKVVAPIAVLDGKFGTAIKLYSSSLSEVPFSHTLKSMYQSLKNLVKWVYAR